MSCFLYFVSAFLKFLLFILILQRIRKLEARINALENRSKKE